jgi:hypothetical protein
MNAVAPLAAELAKACAGVACGLDPSTVERVQREGVSFALVAPGAGGQGLTGPARVDNAVMRDPFWIGKSIGGGLLDPAELGRERMSNPQW